MKVRAGFVANSSSSSFRVSLEDITVKQLQQIQEAAKGTEWDISVGEDSVSGYTIIDNFSMRSLFREIGVDMEKVEWDEY